MTRKPEEKTLRYRFVKDDDGHDYVIPADKLSDFNKWLNSEEAMDGVDPEWSMRLNYHPSQYTFADFKLERSYD